MVKPLEPEAQKRLRRLPPVRRARDYYLYDGRGKRYLDLWQEGGRAWLGHRPEGLTLHLKNAASRGVYGTMPSAEEGKLVKALRALGKELGAEEHSEIRRLPFGLGDKEGGRDIPLWRPGEQWAFREEEVELLIPLPGLDYGQIFFCRKTSVLCGVESPLPSPLLAAALTRVLWSLIAALKEPVDYEILNSEFWEQKGGCLFWKGSANGYDALFNQALEKRILLPPSFRHPAILPRKQSEGDRSLIHAFFRRAL